MKRIALFLLAVAGLSLAACAPHAPDPDRFAVKFFEHGRDSILDTLKDQKVAEPQLKAASDVLDRFQKEAEHNMAVAFRAEQNLMLGLASGRDSAALLKLDEEQNRAQEQALRTIGHMHEELAAAVGDEAWKQASVKLEERYSRYFKPRE